MTLGSLGLLTFASPWILAGLAALPVIWWLLRLTPPRPETVVFPPTLLLLGLKPKEKTPVRSPWWLTLLRMLVAAAVIIALSGPALKPQLSQAAFASKPVLVVADNGWAAASRWPTRRAMAEQLANLAEDAGYVLYLAPTVGLSEPLRPLTPTEFRQQFASLVPQSYPGDRAAVAEQIQKDLGAQRGRIRVLWYTDGLEDSGAEKLRQALDSLAGEGGIEVFADAPGSGALAVYSPEVNAGGAIHARILKAEAVARHGAAAAVTMRGERLAVVPFDIPAQDSSVDVSFELPLDLRNQVSRIEIMGEASAGAVHLLDGRSQRRRVGVIASEERNEAQTLLSPVHYLEKALGPYSDVILARTANLDKATEELIGHSPSAIILSDVGRLGGAPRRRLQAFVEKGGMLVRFAGPRLEQGGDGLLPAPLREGGRTLGGALTWTQPQKPAPFEQGSLFEGLTIPPDVTVSRQVLIDPLGISSDVAVWARLADGTPLVTAAKRGAGQVVFFHVTANPDWSNLPMSGLFVEMMRKVVEASPMQLPQGDQTAPKAENAAPSPSQEAFLKPWRLLDGFGKLAEPGDKALAVASAAIETAHAGPKSPAGLYGQQSSLRAINIITKADALAPLKLPDGARLRIFEEAKTLALTPWLFLIALGLFLADGIVSALLLGRGAIAPRRAATAAAFALGLILISGTGNVRAEVSHAPTLDEATRFALQASLDTRLAYVITGDEEADRISKAGLSGLSKVLMARTAVEPGAPMGIDPSRDELVFFPLIYWPVLANAEPLPDAVLAKVDAYMKQGGLIIFDTKNDATLTNGLMDRNHTTALSQLLGKLDLPPLERVPEDHVLTKSFYLLQSFPGRWDNGELWVESRSEGSDTTRRGVKTDGVSSIIITSNDFAAAWALDDSDRPMFATVPGGEEQREMSYRVGVNIVMYALTGNYKADQVHVPAILERLGH